MPLRARLDEERISLLIYRYTRPGLLLSPRDVGNGFCGLALGPILPSTLLIQGHLGGILGFYSPVVSYPG